MKEGMRRTGLWVLGAFLAACGGDADAGSAGGSTGDEVASSSTTETPSTTAVTETGSSSGTTDPVTTDPPTTATTTGVAQSSTTEATAESGSTTEDCTLGELDCGCDEGSCVDELECTADVCTAPGACEDDEWGDITSEDAAHFLGMIDDDDDNGGNVLGVLTGPDDVDWFRYDGEDSFFDDVDPFRTIAASAGVRFCKFAECPDGIGDTNFDCAEGSVATTSPDGRPGCCADAVLHVTDAICGSTAINDDSMSIWIRVDQAEDACVQYAFDYHF